jgi:hypothetical protein
MRVARGGLADRAVSGSRMTAIDARGGGRPSRGTALANARRSGASRARWCKEGSPMLVPWLFPIAALAVIVAIVVALGARRRRGKLPHHEPHGATSTRP